MDDVPKNEDTSAPSKSATASMSYSMEEEQYALKRKRDERSSALLKKEQEREEGGKASTEESTESTESALGSPILSATPETPYNKSEMLSVTVSEASPSSPMPEEARSLPPQREAEGSVSDAAATAEGKAKRARTTQSERAPSKEDREASYDFSIEPSNGLDYKDSKLENPGKKTQELEETEETKKSKKNKHSGSKESKNKRHSQEKHESKKNSKETTHRGRGKQLKKSDRMREDKTALSLVSAMRTVAKKVCQENEKLSQRAETAEASVKEQTEKINKMQEQIAIGEEQLQKMSDDNRELQKNLDEKQASLEDASSQISDLTQQVKQSEEEREALVKRAEAAENSCKGQEEALSEARELLSKSEEKLGEVASEKAQLETELQTNKTQLEEAKTEIGNLRGEKQRLEKDNARLTEEKKKSEEERYKKEEEWRQAEAKSQDAASQLEQVNALNDSLQQSLTQLKRTATNQIQEKEQTIKSQTNIIATLQSQVESAGQTQETIEKQRQELTISVQKIIHIIQEEVMMRKVEIHNESDMIVEDQTDMEAAKQAMRQSIAMTTQLAGKCKKAESEREALREALDKATDKEKVLMQYIEECNKCLTETPREDQETQQYVENVVTSLDRLQTQIGTRCSWIFNGKTLNKYDMIDDLYSLIQNIKDVVKHIKTMTNANRETIEKQTQTVVNALLNEQNKKVQEMQNEMDMVNKSNKQLEAQLQKKEEEVKEMKSKWQDMNKMTEELEKIGKQMSELSQENTRLREEISSSQNSLLQQSQQSQQNEQQKQQSQLLCQLKRQKPISYAYAKIIGKNKKQKVKKPWAPEIPDVYQDIKMRRRLPENELRAKQVQGIQTAIYHVDMAKKEIETLIGKMKIARWNIERFTYKDNSKQAKDERESQEMKKLGAHKTLYDISYNVIQAIRWLKPVLLETLPKVDMRENHMLISSMALQCYKMHQMKKSLEENNDENGNRKQHEMKRNRAEECGNLSFSRASEIIKNDKWVTARVQDYVRVVHEELSSFDHKSFKEVTSEPWKNNCKITDWFQVKPKETGALGTKQDEVDVCAFEDRTPDKKLIAKESGQEEKEKPRKLIIIKSGFLNVEKEREKIRKSERSKNEAESTIITIERPSKTTKPTTKATTTEKRREMSKEELQKKGERALKHVRLMTENGARKRMIVRVNKQKQQKAPEVLQNVIPESTADKEEKKKETTEEERVEKEKVTNKQTEESENATMETEEEEKRIKSDKRRMADEVIDKDKKEKEKEKEDRGKHKNKNFDETNLNSNKKEKEREKEREREREEEKEEEKENKQPIIKQKEINQNELRKPVIERPKRRQSVVTKTNRVTQLDTIWNEKTQQCVYQCNSETIRVVLPQMLQDPLVDLINLICKKIDGQRSRDDKQYYATLLMQLPAIFLTPPQFKHDDNKSKANEAIKQQINAFIKQGQLPLVQERRIDQPLPMQKKKKASNANGDGNATLDWWNIIFIQRAVQDGNIGRAANGFSLREKADVNNKKVIEQLQQLHPKAYDRNPFAEEGEVEVTEAQISMLDITETISRLKRGKAAGTSEWAYEEVKFLSKQSPSFNKALVSLAKDLSVGEFPCTELLKESRLIAIKKSESSVRPIAMGNAIPKLLEMVVLEVRNREFRNKRGTEEYRLAIKKTVTNTQQKGNEPIKEYSVERKQIKTTYLGLEKEQLGVNSPCGVEVPGFIMMELYKQQKLRKYFTIDISNAFNTVSRKELAKVVREVRPDLYPMVRQLYGTPTTLRLANGATISSEEGVRQGDPLSSYLYALVSNCVLQEEKKIAAEHGCQVFAYLDDHSFIFDDTSDMKLTVRQVLDRIQPILDRLHLRVNRAKCYTYIPKYVRDEEITKEELEGKEFPLKRTGCNCLGTPIGDEQYVAEHVRMKLNKASNVFKHLHEVDVQAVYQVIRLSTSAEAMHLYRALGDHPQYFKEWDECLFVATLQMSNRLSEYEYLQEKVSEVNSELQEQLRDLKEKMSEEERIAKRSRRQSKKDEHQNRALELENKINKIKQTMDENGRKWIDNAFNKYGAQAAELIRADDDFRRARLTMALKQSFGGLGIATAQMSATPAHLGYILDCLKLAREREFKIPLSRETAEYVKRHQDLIDAAKLKLPDEWEKEGTKFYVSGGSVQHLLTTALQQQVSEAIEHRTSKKILMEMAEEEAGYTKTTKELIKSIPTVSLEGEEQFERAYGLVQDMKGKRAALSFSLGAYRRYYTIPNRYMAEMLATKLLIPNRYGIDKCRGPNSDYEHPAVDLNHAYACSNNGARTTTHTMVAGWLMTLLRNAGLAATRETQITSTSDPRYADIFVGSPQTIIDLSGVTTTRMDKSLTDAMEKRYNEKVKLYDDILSSDTVRQEYKQAVVIPFIYGPCGQIYAASEHALLALLGVDNRKLPQQKIATSTRVQFQVCHPNSRVPEKTIKAIKHLWKIMQLNIARYTAENAITWGEQQAKRHHIDIQQYKRPTKAIPLSLRYDLNQSIQQQDQPPTPEELLSKGVFDELHLGQDIELPDNLIAIDVDEQDMLGFGKEEEEEETIAVQDEIENQGEEEAIQEKRKRKTKNGNGKRGKGAGKKNAKKQSKKNAKQETKKKENANQGRKRAKMETNEKEITNQNEEKEKEKIETEKEEKHETKEKEEMKTEKEEEKQETKEKEKVETEKEEKQETNTNEEKRAIIRRRKNLEEITTVTTNKNGTKTTTIKISRSRKRREAPERVANHMESKEEEMILNSDAPPYLRENKKSTENENSKENKEDGSNSSQFSAVSSLSSINSKSEENRDN